MKRRLHCRIGEQRKRLYDGKSALAFGVRAGYWPCLSGVHIKVDYGPRFFEAAFTPYRPDWWDYKRKYREGV